MEALAERHAFDVEVMRDPRPFDEYLLANHPVFWDEVNKFFIVSNHALLSEVLLDADTFSSEYLEKFLPQTAPPAEVAAIYARGCPLSKALLVVDGDLHRQHRKIISRALSRKKLSEMAPAIRARISDLLDTLLPTGRMKFRSEFAQKIPVYITQHILKIPDADMPKAIEWSEIVSSGFGGLGKSLDRQKADAVAIIEFQEYFRAKIEAAMEVLEKQGSIIPDQDDLCAMLGAAVLDPEDPMTMGDALSFILILIPATHDTTTGSATACAKSFVEHPEVQRRLAEDPSFIPAFIDEAMRLESPNRAFWRLARRDSILGGVEVPAGSWLLMRLTAANHDPSVYADPYSFNLDRRGEKPHLEFGTGVHMCVGRPAARMIITEAFTQLAARARNYRFVDGENDFEMDRSLLFSGYRDLTIGFDPV